MKPDVHLASISGGTDLCGCFVGGDPTRPVWPGEIQGPALGMAVDVFDDDGQPLPAGHRASWSARSPFPSMPLGFWGDADGSPLPRRLLRALPGRVGPRRLRRRGPSTAASSSTAAPTPP